MLKIHYKSISIGKLKIFHSRFFVHACQSQSLCLFTICKHHLTLIGNYSKFSVLSDVQKVSLNKPYGVVGVVSFYAYPSKIDFHTKCRQNRIKIVEVSQSHVGGGGAVWLASQKDFLITSKKDFLINVWGWDLRFPPPHT